MASLYSKSDPSKKLSLKHVDIHLEVLELLANASVSQRFVNEEPTPIEVVYKFSYGDESSTIYHFEAEVDGKIYRSRVKSKEKAKEAYDDAIASGQTSFMMNQEQVSPLEKVFEINLGNLRSQQEITLRWKMAFEVSAQGEKRNLLFSLSDLFPNFKKNSITWSLNVTLVQDSEVEKFSSSTHEFEEIHSSSSSENNNNKNHKVRSLKVLSPKQQSDDGGDDDEEENEQDFELQMQVREGNKQACWIEEFKTSKNEVCRAALLSYFPQLKQEEKYYNLVFVIDRSGSMSGDKIRQARETLSLFIRSLPVNGRIKFNVVSFGSNYTFLFPGGSVEYTEATFKQADAHASSLEADYGGTELVNPLKGICEMNSKVGNKYENLIFVLTDGQVSDRNSVLSLCENKSKEAKFFAVGIGSDVDRELVSGIANKGKGLCEFVIGTQKIQSKLMKLVKYSLSSSYNSVAIEWPNSLQKLKARTLPSDKTVIIDGERFVGYALWDEPIKDRKNYDNEDVKLVAMSKEGQKFENVSKLKNSTDIRLRQTKKGDPEIPTTPSLVHVMAVRMLISELENLSNANLESKLKEEIISLSTKFNVLTNFTTFLVVSDELTGGDSATQQSLQIRTIDATSKPKPSPSSQYASQAVYAPSPLTAQSFRSYGYSAALAPPPPPSSGPPPPPSHVGPTPPPPSPQYSSNQMVYASSVPSFYAQTTTLSSALFAPPPPALGSYGGPLAPPPPPGAPGLPPPPPSHVGPPPPPASHAGLPPPSSHIAPPPPSPARAPPSLGGLPPPNIRPTPDSTSRSDSTLSSQPVFSKKNRKMKKSADVEYTRSEKKESFALPEPEEFEERLTLDSDMDRTSVASSSLLDQIQGSSFLRSPVQAHQHQHHQQQQQQQQQQSLPQPQIQQVQSLNTKNLVLVNISELFKLQSFQGTWTVDQRLRGLLSVQGLSSDVLIEKIQQESEKKVQKRVSDLELLGTVLVVCLLKKHFKKNKVEWQLLVTKAEQWLDSKPQQVDWKELTRLVNSQI